MLFAFALALLTGAASASTSDDAFAAFKRKDYETAFRLWEQCGKQGVASCQYDVGLMYLNGEGRPVDIAAALDWMSRSAGLGHAPAQNRLGNLYLSGKVVTQDYAHALQYYVAAARQNYAAGQANIGLIYWKGYGVPIDLVEGFAWSQLSTERLASGAKQRDEILNEMTPDQWTKGRDRAAALRKELAPSSSASSSSVSISEILEIASGVLILVLAFAGLAAFWRSRKQPKARS